MKPAPSRLAVLVSAAAAAWALAACEPKPSNPPKPSTIELPTTIDQRPIDTRLLT
jgi:hypothetical protein